MSLDKYVPVSQDTIWNAHIQSRVPNLSSDSPTSDSVYRRCAPWLVTVDSSSTCVPDFHKYIWMEF